MIAKHTRTTTEQFTCGGPDVQVFYVVAYENGVEIKSVPVVGWLRRRRWYSDDTFEETIEPGVLNTEYRTVETADEVLGSFEGSSNTEVIGVYFAGEKPDDVDIEVAKDTLRDNLRCRWKEADGFTETHRAVVRKQIAAWATALNEVPPRKPAAVEAA